MLACAHLALAGFGPAARAAPGDLDLSFNATGIVMIEEFAINSVAIQPDGKIVAAGADYSEGASTLTRYNPDGSLDTGFGTGGLVTESIGDPYFSSVALQTDGKIVVGGHSDNGTQLVFYLARYNPDGSLDTGFGSGGRVTTTAGESGAAYSVALQPDGKIVAAGYSYNGIRTDFSLLRYNPDGSLDTGFGLVGQVTTAIGTYSLAYAVALQPDGKIVAAGTSGNGPQVDVFALARYNPDGSLDTSFGSGGKVTTAIGIHSDIARSVALQPDGKIVVGGSSSFDGVHDLFALARYNPDGSLDTGFGAGGKVTTAIGSISDAAYSIALQPDSKIVAAGESTIFESLFIFLRHYQIGLTRYNPDGSLDITFGNAGKVTTTDNIAAAYAVALQPDGRIVAGVSGALVRYLGDAISTSTAIPTLATWSSLALSILVAGLAAWTMRRRFI